MTARFDLARPPDRAPAAAASAFPGECRDVFRELDRLLGLADQWNSIGHGDESDGHWFPLALPWDAQIDGDRLTEMSLLIRLGAHRELVDTTCAMTSTSFLNLLSLGFQPNSVPRAV